MLEQDLGVRVVERLSRSYRLTPEGEQVRDRAREIEARIADIARFANTVDPLPNRVVRVNGPPSLLSQFLAPRLLPLQGQASRACASNSLSETRQISLSQGEADLALRMSRPVEKGVIARKLAVVAYGLYASRDYLARCGGDAQDFLGFDDSLDHSPQQRWLKMLAGERGFTLRSNDIANLLTAARAGLGLAVLPCIMVRGARRTGPRSHAIAAADARAMAAVPSRRRPDTRGSRRDRPHHRDHDAGEGRVPRRQPSPGLR